MQLLDSLRHFIEQAFMVRGQDDTLHDATEHANRFGDHAKLLDTIQNRSRKWCKHGVGTGGGAAVTGGGG